MKAITHQTDSLNIQIHDINLTLLYMLTPTYNI